MSDLLLRDEPAPHVVRLTLNRPEQLNTMTAELCEALHEQLRELALRARLPRGDPDGRRARLLRGARPARLRRGTGQHRRATSRATASPTSGTCRAWSSRCASIPQPVIAAVNGPSAGFGLALALGCDIRFAAREAVFRAAFINIGVSNCDMVTSWLLPRLIGASRSHELMLTGRRFDAEEALRIGLVADVVEQDALAGRALEAAEQISALAPFGVQLTKQGMWSALEIPSAQTAAEYEDRQQIMATFGAAPPEAIGAFLEKRPAQFAD